MQKRTLLKAMAAGLVALPAAAFAADAAPAAAGASPLPPPGPGCGCPPPPPPVGCPGQWPHGPHGAYGPQGYGHPGPHPGRRGDPWGASPEEVDRLAEHVRASLGITEEQRPAFDAWVAAKKEAAASRGKLRDEILAAKDGQARAELHLKAVRARADQMEKVVKARGRLAEALTDEQRKLFDRFENGHRPRGGDPGAGRMPCLTPRR